MKIDSSSDNTAAPAISVDDETSAVRETYIRKSMAHAMTNQVHRILKFCFLGKLLLPIGFFILTSEAASAGTLTETPNLEQCDYLFSGEVEPGDALKIESMIPARYDGSRLCLNSPGGDFTEGLKMFQVIWNKDSVATLIRSGDSCMSACALAFLGGSLVQGTGTMRSKNTVIEPGARLGFHAPRLVLPQGNAYEAATVQNAYTLAISSSAELFQLTQQVDTGAWGMTEFLFYQTLKTPPESIYEVDTVGKANLSGVQIANVPIPEFSWTGFKNVCDTAIVMLGGNGEKADSIERSFSNFSDIGYDGWKEPIAFKDRTWSWKSDYFLNFVVRGYQAPHKNEKFCRVSASRIALDRELNLPLSERDPSTQSFSVTLWEDAAVPVGNSFSNYAETNTKEDAHVAVPWIALWDPSTPLDSFITR
jgi:hypothetical protein